MRLVISVCVAMLIKIASHAQSYEDVTNDVGIFQVPIHQDLMGGGITWLDYDNDGWSDVYFTGCRIRDVLFRNNGNGTFSDVTLEAGLTYTDAFNTMGVIHGDVNNDGNEDIFLTVWDEAATNVLARNILYLNNGDGTFTDISVSAGITDASFSTSAVFLDVNLDGFLDIYVLNYMESTGFIEDEEGNTVGFDHNCYADYFYLNNGDLTFTESSESYGFTAEACGLAVSSNDVDKDGDPDILIANDFGEFLTPNELYINNYPEPSFTEVGSETGWDIGLYGMGVAAGDIDNDLDLDYYITNLGSNALLVREDDLMFTDTAAFAEVQNTGSENFLYTSWGDLFLDVDNDTHLDLYVSNGHIPSATFIQNEQADPNRLFMNNGDLTFTDFSEQAGVDYLGICRGAAYSDYDKDGRLDISVSGIENPFFSAYEGVKLYRNTSVEMNNWLTLTLEGTMANRNAYGSGVTLYAEGQSFYRELSGGSSHLSQNESILHFGLGEIEQVDSAVVSWIGGQTQTEYDLEINEFHHVIQDFNSSLDELMREECGIFPNPASSDGEVTVSIPQNIKSTLSVRNSLGQVILNEELQGIKTYSLNLASGIYIVSVHAQGVLWNQKLIISE